MCKTNYPLVYIDWNLVEELTKNISNKIIKDNKKIDVIVPIIRGGMPIAMLLSYMLNVKEMSCLHIRRSVDDRPNTEFKSPINRGITNPDSIKNSNILIVDDILDSKITLDYAIEVLKQYEPKNIEVAVLYNFNKNTFNTVYSGKEELSNKWIIFPWEKN